MLESKSIFIIVHSAVANFATYKPIVYFGEDGEGSKILGVLVGIFWPAFEGYTIHDAGTFEPLRVVNASASTAYRIYQK